MPEVTVEIAFTSGLATPIADMAWTDVSEYVEGQIPLTINRGRGDEFAEVSPSELTLTFDNTDGRFTPGNESGAYWPNIKKGRPIRLSVEHDGVSYPRFFGYIADWPVLWPTGGDETSAVTIRARSRMARVTRSMRSVIEEEYRTPPPLAYYTLGEDSEATVAVDSSGNSGPNLAQTGTGDDVVFGDATGPGTDEMSAPTFAAGKYLSGTPLTIAAPSGFTVAGVFNTGVAAGTIVDLPGVGIKVSLNLSGQVQVTHNGAALLGATSNVATSSTAMFVLAIDASQAGLFVDGALESTAASGLSVVGSTAVSIGEGFAGTISHVAIWEHDFEYPNLLWAAVDTGFAGETPRAAVERFARYAEIPADEVDADTGSTAALVFISTEGKTPLEAMRIVESTEYGSLFDGRDGTLVFRGRGARFNSTSAFALSALSQHVGSGLTPTLDDQGMTNIVDAVRAEPGAPIAHATNQASVDEYGPYLTRLELVTASDSEVVDAATWRVSRFGEPAIRIPDVEVDVTNLDSLLAASVLAADLGTRFTLEGLPAQAPWESIDLFVEGTTESISHEIHTLSLATSTTDMYDAWQLEVAGHGELDQTTLLGY